MSGTFNHELIMKKDFIARLLTDIKWSEQGMELILNEVKIIEENISNIKRDIQLKITSIGCDFKRGAFIVDTDNLIIYKKEFPNYYGLLKVLYKI